MISPLATLPLSARSRVSQITFHPRESVAYLAVQSHDRSVEVFRVRTEEEVRKKQARRKKREKEKKTKGKDKDVPAEAEMDVDGDNERNDDVTLEDLFTPYLVVRASGKVRSFSFVDEEVGPKGDVQVSFTLYNHKTHRY